MDHRDVLTGIRPYLDRRLWHLAMQHLDRLRTQCTGRALGWVELWTAVTLMGRPDTVSGALQHTARAEELLQKWPQDLAAVYMEGTELGYKMPCLVTARAYREKADRLWALLDRTDEAVRYRAMQEINIGLLAEMEGDLIEALRRYRSAATLASSLPVHLQDDYPARAYLDQVPVLLRLGERDAAGAALQAARQALPGEALLGSLELAAGQILRARGELDEAETHLSRAHTHAKATHNDFTLAEVYVEWTLLQRQMGRPEWTDMLKKAKQFAAGQRNDSALHRLAVALQSAR